MIVKYTTFTCGCSGKLESKFTNMLKPKLILKTSCDARIGACVNEVEKWILRILNL